MKDVGKMNVASAIVFVISLFAACGWASPKLLHRRRRLVSCAIGENGLAEGCECGKNCCYDDSVKSGVCYDPHVNTCDADSKVVGLKEDGEVCVDPFDFLGYGGDCKGFCDAVTMSCKPYTPEGAPCTRDAECKGLCKSMDGSKKCENYKENVCDLFEGTGAVLLAILFGLPALILIACILWCIKCRSRSEVNP